MAHELCKKPSSIKHLFVVPTGSLQSLSGMLVIRHKEGLQEYRVAGKRLAITTLPSVSF